MLQIAKGVFGLPIGRSRNEGMNLEKEETASELSQSSKIVTRFSILPFSPAILSALQVLLVCSVIAMYHIICFYCIFQEQYHLAQVEAFLPTHALIDFAWIYVMKYGVCSILSNMKLDIAQCCL